MKIFDRLTVILSEISSTETISCEQTLQGDLALDSLNMVTLLMMIEDEFQIVLDESNMNPFDLVTVEDVVKLVTKYMEGDNHE